MGKKQSTVTVKQNTENHIPIEILADSILEISNGVRKMRSGRLTDKAIILLISDNCTVGKPAIKEVLESMQSLSFRYLKS